MATKVQHEKFSMYKFDKAIKQFCFRIDTEDEYQIVIVPPYTSTDNIPERLIIIAGPPNIEKSVHICSVKPG